MHRNWTSRISFKVFMIYVNSIRQTRHTASSLQTVSKQSRKNIERDKTSKDSKEIMQSTDLGDYCSLTQDIIVSYSDSGCRTVKCFCGEQCNSSVIPHLSRNHPEIWKVWQRNFVELYNQG